MIAPALSFLSQQQEVIEMARKSTPENKSATSAPAEVEPGPAADEIEYGAETSREEHEKSGYRLADNFYEVPKALEDAKDVSTSKQAREKVKE